MFETTLTVAALERTIATLPSSLRDECLHGDCDAFALALYDWLVTQNVPASLIVGARRAYDGNKLVEENLLSHVVVDALGQDWDALGPNASARWDEQWDPHRDDGEDHRFTWTTLTPTDLQALRQAKDRRAVNAQQQAVCHQALQAGDLHQAMAHPTSTVRARRATP